MMKKRKIERIPLSDIVENVNNKEYSVIGVIGKHHGKDGEVKVFSYIDDLELFENCLKDVVKLFNKTTGELKHLRVHSKKHAKENSFYVKFEEINNLSETESILNYEIYIRNDQLPELDNGYYFYQVIGADVVSGGKSLGRVVDVIKTGSNDVFEILQNDGTEILVPVIERYVKNIDKKNKIVEIIKPLWK